MKPALLVTTDEPSRIAALIEQLTDLYVDWISHADLTRLLPFGIGKAEPVAPQERPPQPDRPGEVELAAAVQRLRPAKPLRWPEGRLGPDPRDGSARAQRHTDCELRPHHALTSFASNPGEVGAASPRSREPAAAS